MHPQKTQCSCIWTDREEGLEEGLEKGREENQKDVIVNAYKENIPAEIIAKIIYKKLEVIMWNAMILNMMDWI